jgi:hypothetical protein
LGNSREWPPPHANLGPPPPPIQFLGNGPINGGELGGRIISAEMARLLNIQLAIPCCLMDLGISLKMKITKINRRPFSRPIRAKIAAAASSLGLVLDLGAGPTF